jgi:hypothetical protein
MSADFMPFTISLKERERCYYFNYEVVSYLPQKKMKIRLQQFIICPLQSTAGHKTLQLVAISLELRLLASRYCQVSCANHHSTWPEGDLHYVHETRSPLQNSFNPTVVSSTADVTSPLSLQSANTVCYVGDFSSLANQLLSNSIPQ